MEHFRNFRLFSDKALQFPTLFCLISFSRIILIYLPLLHFWNAWQGLALFYHQHSFNIPRGPSELLEASIWPLIGQNLLFAFHSSFLGRAFHVCFSASSIRQSNQKRLEWFLLTAPNICCKNAFSRDLFEESIYYRWADHREVPNISCNSWTVAVRSSILT